MSQGVIAKSVEICGSLYQYASPDPPFKLVKLNRRAAKSRYLYNFSRHFHIFHMCLEQTCSDLCKAEGTSDGPANSGIL